MTVSRRSLRAFLLLVTVAGAVRAGSAQVPLLRARLSALRDSLRADSTGTGFAAPADPRSPEDRLRAGFILLARGSRDTTAAPLAAALDQFYEVTVRAPRWPYAWLGLGLAKLRMDSLGIPEIRSPHQPAGTGWLAGAQTAFEESLKRDRDLGLAAEGAAEILRRSRTGSTATRAAALLRSYAAAHPIDAAASLALARLAIESDGLDSADHYLHQYLAGGGDSSVADWHRAWIAFARGEPTVGSERYYRAAEGSAATAALIREDLSLIATPTELSGFDQTIASSRPDWLHQFWAQRDVADGRPKGSRLTEHFRRVRYAKQNFALVGQIRQYAFSDVYRNAPVGIDDRGAIYIRHGEPDERATYVGDAKAKPNESWLYFRPAGNLIFHFCEDPYTSGFRLTEDLSVISTDLAGVYESRGGLDIRYLRLASLYDLEAGRKRTGVQEPSLVSPEALARERQFNRGMIHLGVSTDSDPLDLERAWEPIVQAYGTVDPATDSTGVLVVVSLPVPRDIDTLSVPGGTGYIVRLRATAADDSGRVALDSDVVRHLRTPRSLTRNESLTLIEHYPVGPGEQRLRLIVADSTEARGAVRIVPGLPVVRLRGDSLAVSDVIAGRVGSTVTWRRPDGHVVELQPNNAWRPQDQMSIAFDVGGLHSGGSYRVQIGIADLGADTTRPPKAAISFENQATGPREFISQQLGLRALKPGKYLLTAIVTAGNRSIRRERRITIVGG